MVYRPGYRRQGTALYIVITQSGLVRHLYVPLQVVGQSRAPFNDSCGYVGRSVWQHDHRNLASKTRGAWLIDREAAADRKEQDVAGKPTGLCGPPWHFGSLRTLQQCRYDGILRALSFRAGSVVRERAFRSSYRKGMGIGTCRDWDLWKALQGYLVLRVPSRTRSTYIGSTSRETCFTSTSLPRPRVLWLPSSRMAARDPPVPSPRTKTAPSKINPCSCIGRKRFPALRRYLVWAHRVGWGDLSSGLDITYLNKYGHVMMFSSNILRDINYFAMAFRRGPSWLTVRLAPTATSLSLDEGYLWQLAGLQTWKKDSTGEESDYTLGIVRK